MQQKKKHKNKHKAQQLLEARFFVVIIFILFPATTEMAKTATYNNGQSEPSPQQKGQRKVCNLEKRC